MKKFLSILLALTCLSIFGCGTLNNTRNRHTYKDVVLCDVSKICYENEAHRIVLEIQTNYTNCIAIFSQGRCLDSIVEFYPTICTKKREPVLDNTDPYRLVFKTKKDCQ